MIRTVQTEIITETIKKMCIEANYSLSSDMVKAMRKAEEKEESVLGKQILAQLQDNLEIAASDMIPICQDTGMAVVFLEVGQDVHFEGGSFEDAVNEGVRRGYTEGFLRKSVVGDPILRENTKDNTPAVIHTRIVEGDRVKITVAPKGFGSENMSRVFMLKPAEGLEGVKNAILTAVKDAGPNACPPLVVGVGIGGTFEKCALMAKKALTREVGKHSDIPYVRKLEEEMLEKINCLGIGPGGLGGTVTALAVNVNTYPTGPMPRQLIFSHTRIVEGDRVKITVAPKGFGSENMSRVFMLKPAEGLEGVKNAILTAVKDAGPNACPPLVVGVGIGGTFEKCALMAKKALTREVGKHSDIPYVRKLEEEMLEKINCLGIGPGGLGGTVTALAVNVNTYPTHIAGLPVAVNICCHVNRHTVCVL